MHSYLGHAVYDCEVRTLTMSQVAIKGKAYRVVVKNGKTFYVYQCSECKNPVKLSQPTSFDVICSDCSAPDYLSQCEVCGATPVVPQTGMCGPCTFGDADTVGGNW